MFFTAYSVGDINELFSERGECRYGVNMGMELEASAITDLGMLLVGLRKVLIF
ncbi:hypothetical protein [Flavicella sp.]|uniref:hypothetical protein n=1 Tax=Flavicella sp. TaxID=2957742 RepID=UPI0030195F9D